MTALEAIAHFGNSHQLTTALGLKPNSVFSWKDGEIPPLHQIRLEALTEGVLRADDAAWAPAQPRFAPKRKSK